jgi:dTDP-4-dehydrorhamnose 3,5-epimerase
MDDTDSVADAPADAGNALPNGWLATSLDGVLRRQALPNTDERGSFTELWRASQTDPLAVGKMVQANLSRSRAGVLRGMHFHLRQADLWLLVDGECATVATDLRPALRGGQAVSEVFAMKPGDALLIPPRVAHGFLAVTDMSLVYLVSHEYDGSDEYGFAWDDPAARIAWPSEPTVVSARDRFNPSLQDVIARLGQASQTSGA